MLFSFSFLFFFFSLYTTSVGVLWARYYTRWPRATLQVSPFPPPPPPATLSTSAETIVVPVKESEKGSKAQLTLRFVFQLRSWSSKHMLHSISTCFSVSCGGIILSLQPSQTSKMYENLNALSKISPCFSVWKRSLPIGRSHMPSNHTTITHGSQGMFRLEWRSAPVSRECFSPRQSYLRHWLVWWTTWGKERRKRKNEASSWSSPRPSFLSEGWRLPKKLNLRRGSLTSTWLIPYAMKPHYKNTWVEWQV